MAPPLIIKVNGESTLIRRAERGILNATVTSTNSSQQSASEDVIKTSNKLRDILVGLAPKDAEGLATADAPVTLFSMGGVTTSANIPRAKHLEKPDREYTATATFTAEFCDFTKLGQIISTLLRMPYVEVSRTEWRLTAATRQSLGAESRKLAMQDAIRKAEDYAGMVDRTPAAIEVSEYTPLYNQSARGGQVYSGNPGTHVEGMTMEPEHVKIRTVINVTFQAD